MPPCAHFTSIRRTGLALVGVHRYGIRRTQALETPPCESYGINFTAIGTWKCRIAGRYYDVKPSSVMVQVPGDRYVLEHVAAQPHTSYVVQLTPGAIDDDAPLLFKERVMTIGELGRYIMRAAACDDDDEFDSTIYSIFDLVSRQSLRGERGEKASPFRVQRIKRFIEAHCVERLTLSDLAASVGLNRYTCLRQFKAITGETPFAYVVRCRIEKAKQLLQLQKIAIEDVARRTGFASHAYFCRTFKRTTGLSPGAFRRLQ